MLCSSAVAKHSPVPLRMANASVAILTALTLAILSISLIGCVFDTYVVLKSS